LEVCQYKTTHAVHSRDIDDMGDKTDNGCKKQDKKAEGPGEDDAEQDDKDNDRPVHDFAVETVEPVGRSRKPDSDDICSTGGKHTDDHQLTH